MSRIAIACMYLFGFLADLKFKTWDVLGTSKFGSHEFSEAKSLFYRSRCFLPKDWMLPLKAHSGSCTAFGLLNMKVKLLFVARNLW